MADPHVLGALDHCGGLIGRGVGVGVEAEDDVDGRRIAVGLLGGGTDRFESVANVVERLAGNGYRKPALGAAPYALEGGGVAPAR
jgi:hypothetical protein